MQTDEVRRMAGEVAGLMADRLGGARRGTVVDLDTMLRRRGGALPRKLRREARRLAAADTMVQSPRIARQIDLAPLRRAHHALMRHLRPLGSLGRWRSGVGGVAATVVLGLLLLGAATLWVLVWRGYL